ncbi:hypothetical protein HDV01_002122 [Terramyces sp. JEL0728]|nr:hypothetical protein HDV01_002122 [Terramyces sp. JEL0728]
MKDSIMQEHHTHKANEIISIAAQQWRAETKETKDYYKQKSKQLYAEHAKKYPDFVWPSKTSKQQKLALRTTLLKVVNQLGPTVESPTSLSPVNQIGSPTLSDSSHTTLSMMSPLQPSEAAKESPKASPCPSNTTIDGLDQIVQPLDFSSFFPLEYQYTIPDPFPLYYNPTQQHIQPNPFDFLFD